MQKGQSPPQVQNACNALQQCLGAVGSVTPEMHSHTAWGRWAVELMPCTA